MPSFRRGARAQVRNTVAQFGLVMILPGVSWSSMSSRWGKLTWGMRRGVWESIRKAEALLKTWIPRCASLSSCILATSDGRAEMA